ncbi:hypothetical protein BKA69DRAFT_352491 [Paraphysoderma sedebokerense]|nr:hypothetical protein BKA69DRAFT_352491 [Paraphysoderma sedebokerense]
MIKRQNTPPSIYDQHDIPVPVAASTDPDIQTMNLIQYSDLVKASRDLRHSLHLVSQTANTLSRVLNSIRHCRTSEQAIPQEQYANMSYFVDVCKLLGSTHQNLGDAVWRELETPLLKDLEQVNVAALSVQRENEQKLTTLSKELKATEQKSQKQRKNKNRDLVGFQQTIAHLNNLAQEIKRLELNNVACGDDIAEKRLGFVFDKCEHAVTNQVEGYMNVGEGLKQLAIQSASFSPAASRSLSNFTAGRRNSQ